MKEYEFDFYNSLGDTISEKFESLFMILVKIHEESPIRTIISDYNVMLIFESQRNFVATPVIAIIGDLNFVGEWSSPYKNIRFQCVKSCKMGNNELLILSENGNSLIKFKNFTIED